MASTLCQPLLLQAEQRMIATYATVPLVANQVMEYITSVALSLDTTLEDLTEATYNGYTRGSIASWLGPELDIEGNLVVVPVTPVVFSCSGSTTVNTVIGVGILDSTGTTLLAAADYATALSPVPGQVHRVTPDVALTGQVDVCLC